MGLNSMNFGSLTSCGYQFEDWNIEENVTTVFVASAQQYPYFKLTCHSHIFGNKSECS